MIPVALQMYTLREESAKDFAGTLKKVADLGYTGVELAGYGGLTAKEVRSLLDDLGLKVASSHVSLEELQNDVDKVIEDQKILGSNFIVCPYLSPEQRTDEGLKSLVPLLNEIGEKCKLEGLTFCYHNHDFELERLSDGRTILETIFAEVSSDHLQAELDVYWLKKAGEDPIEWIKKYSGRTPLVHLKDMTNDDEQFFAELGTGGVDIEGILKLGDEANVQWWIVEQDASRKTPLESVEISMQYLKEKLTYLAK